VSAVSSDDPTNMPVAEEEVDAEDERDAIEKAKELFRKTLTTLKGLQFSAIPIED